MAELDKPLEGAALYDKLYAGGYHNDLRLSHGLYLMYDLTEVAAWYNLTSVLDVGCSHGLVVEPTVGSRRVDCVWCGRFYASC